MQATAAQTADSYQQQRELTTFSLHSTATSGSVPLMSQPHDVV